MFSDVVAHGGVSSLLAVLSWRVPALDFAAMILPEGGWKGTGAGVWDGFLLPGFVPVHEP